MTIWKRRKCMDTYHQMNRTAATKLKYLYRFFTADVSRRQLSNGSFLQFSQKYLPREVLLTLTILPNIQKPKARHFACTVQLLAKSGAEIPS